MEPFISQNHLCKLRYMLHTYEYHKIGLFNNDEVINKSKPIKYVEIYYQNLELYLIFLIKE